MSEYDRGYIQALRDAVVMANETSDNQGNLYRIDYINRVNHEIEDIESMTFTEECLPCAIVTRGEKTWPNPLPDDVPMCSSHWNRYLASALAPDGEYLPTRVHVIEGGAE